MLPGRIRELRKDQGISQQRLAETLGVSQQTIAGWEGGRTCPDRFMLARMVEMFRVSSDYMLGITNDARSPVEATKGAPELSGVYLSMAKQLRDEGITQEDLQVMLEVHKRFTEINGTPEQEDQTP